ncbi:MAG: hypothetical protein JXB62_07060 [Pirellulales bacterium]|nr:hypothetical protein [Pirellulales bacterium]
MFKGLDHVSRAVELLVGRNAMLNQRLCEAAHEFAVALHRPEQWPEDLLPKARQVESRLTARGSIDDTISGMDVADADEVAQQMCELATAVGVAKAMQREAAHVKVPPRKGRRRTRHAASRTAHKA